MNRWLIVIAAIPSMVLAQGKTSEFKLALTDIKISLENHGTGASVSGLATFKFSNHLIASSGCGITFRSNTEYYLGGDSRLITVNLTQMSPAVRVTKWRTASLWAVVASNTSGQPDIAASSRSVFQGKKATSEILLRELELTMDDEKASHQIQRALQEAIVACGGVTRDPALQARVDLEDSLSQVRLAARMDMGLRNPAYGPLKQLCRDMIKSTLKFPESATFPPDSSIIVMGTGDSRSVVVLGVDAQNNYGALVRTNKKCLVERYGNTWIPKGTPTSTRPRQTSDPASDH